MADDRPQIIIECLHVDDEMWSFIKTAYTIRRDIRQAIGDGRDWTDPKPTPGVKTVTLEPIPLRDEFHLDGQPTALRLTQTSSFVEARQLIDRRYFQLVIADAVDENAGEMYNQQDFLTYSGCGLLRAARACSEQRLIYSIDYERWHDRREIDLVAGDLAAFVTDHPLHGKKQERFRDRVERMVEIALKNPILDAFRTFARLTEGDHTDEVGLEILERVDGGWRTLVKKFPLLGVARNSPGHVGPSAAEYVTFLWFLGYSRGRRVSNRGFPMPKAGSGTGSWVRALSTVYGKLVENRNEQLFPDKKAFKEAIDAGDGFWPGSRRWQAGQKRATGHARIPRLCLNLMTPVPCVKGEWMPEYEYKGEGKAWVEYRKSFSREVVRSVLPYLPRRGDAADGLFPLSDRDAFDGEPTP